VRVFGFFFGVWGVLVCVLLVFFFFFGWGVVCFWLVLDAHRTRLTDVLHVPG